jgi:hypothetical protein
MALIDDPAVAAAIDALIEGAPPLTPEQETRLSVLLAPVMREPWEDNLPEAA